MVGPHRLPCETPEAHQPSEVSGQDTRWVLPATILGSSMSFIDGSVVNIALPAIQHSLATSFGALQWVVNGYMLTFASLILFGGSAGDRYGRRRVFIIGLLLFALASLICGLAPSATSLVAARIAQGAGAALLTPTSLAIIGSAYSGESRGVAIGTWAAAGALTTALGPPLGGWLVDTIGWRSIFFINLPVAAVALLFALKLPRDREINRSEPLDRSGAVLAVLSLGLLTYGLIALGEGALIEGAVALICAVPAIWILIRLESRTRSPMMPLALFRDRNFSGANALTVLLYAALGGSLFLLPFLLIQVHGYSATAAGAAFLPFSAIIGLGSRWSGGLVNRFGARLPLVRGPDSHRSRLRDPGVIRRRPELLERRPSRPHRCCHWHDHHDRAPDNDRVRLRTERDERHGLWHQQCRRAHGQPRCDRRARSRVRRGIAGCRRLGAGERVPSCDDRGSRARRSERAHGGADHRLPKGDID